MKAKYFFVLLMFLFAVPVIAAAQDNSNPTSSQSEVVKAKPGTYQFQISNKKTTPVFSDEILIEVEQKRQQSETTYMYPAVGVVIIIPSRDAINDPAFVPLEEVIYQ